MILACAGLAACGPVSVENAESQCFERARLAESPRGRVAVGVGTGGLKSDVEVEITSDFIQGRDPSQVYETCVVQKSGQLPRVPLYLRPDWPG